MNAAAIDLGTNSIKILIVKRNADGHMEVLFRHRSVVRLGEGTFQKNKIPRYVQLRTLKVFQTYAKLLEAYKVDVVRVTGTSALRESKNGPEFVREVRAKTGLALEVLPAEEEARLIVKGVSSEFPLPRTPTYFIDIGGGSCEISLVRNQRIEKFVSLPLGAVRLTEKFFGAAKPDKASVKKLDAHIQKVLREAWPERFQSKRAFGSAGTIRTLSRLIDRTELTDEENLLRRTQLLRTRNRIELMSKKQLAALPGVDARRAEILNAGTRVLAQVFEYFGIEQLKVSQRGLREGLLIDLFSHPQKPVNQGLGQMNRDQLEQIQRIAKRYNSNSAHCQQVCMLARTLFEELAPIHGLGPEFRTILLTASLLHDVGHFIDESSNHKHSYYILRNTEFNFLNDRERLMMATAARYHRKSPPRAEHEGYRELSPVDQKITQILASILRMADALDAPHAQSVKWIKCQWGVGKVRIGADLRTGGKIDAETVKDKMKLFEELFKVSVTVLPMQELSTAHNGQPVDLSQKTVRQG